MKRFALRTTALLFAAILCWQSTGLEAAYGRVDAAPMWMRVKMKANKKTMKYVDLWGGRFDATIVPVKGYGFCIKPFAFGGRGEETRLLSYGAGIGHYTPVSDRLTLIPVVGASHTYMKTYIDLPMSFPGSETTTIYPHEQEKLESYSVYFGAEAVFKINSTLYFTALYNYGFARVDTKIGKLVDTRGGSNGSNVGMALDYYINDVTSLNVGVGYNTSLDKEQNGIDGYGVKAGISYMF